MISPTSNNYFRLFSILISSGRQRQPLVAATPSRSVRPATTTTTTTAHLLQLTPDRTVTPALPECRNIRHPPRRGDRLQLATQHRTNVVEQSNNTRVTVYRSPDYRGGHPHNCRFHREEHRVHAATDRFHHRSAIVAAAERQSEESRGQQ